MSDAPTIRLFVLYDMIQLMKYSIFQKLSITLTLLSALFVMSTQSVHARVNSSAQVLGYVSDCDNNVPFVSVTATCGTQTLSGLTGSTGGDNGKYSLTFNNSSCKKGSSFTVSAEGVTSSGTIGNYFFFSNIGNADIQLGTNCETTSVPEFGMFERLIAIFASAAVFFYLHSRVSANKA